MTTRDRQPETDPVLERLALDHRPGPAARISSARASALVQAAVDEAFEQGLLPSVPPEPVRARFFDKPWVRALAMAAAGLLMLVGGAAAAKLVMEALSEPQSAPAEPIAPVKAPQKVARKAVVPPPDERALPNEPALPELPAPAPIKSARRDTKELDAISEDLLQAANRARAAGQFRDAADTYAEVYERHPGSLSAYVAEVAAGSLELEHLDRPDRAVRLFRRALRTRPGGALDLEARQGLAIALRDLGRAREEMAALKALIATHPDRPAAERARARLDELSSPAP